MGVDCYIRIGDNFQEMLDRHYVFSDVFEDGKKYTKKEALALLNKIKPFGREDYFLYWIDYAKNLINEHIGDIVILSEDYMWNCE